MFKAVVSVALLILSIFTISCQSVIGLRGQRTSDNIIHYPPADRAPSQQKSSYRSSSFSDSENEELCPPSDQSASCRQIRELRR